MFSELNESFGEIGQLLDEEVMPIAEEGEAVLEFAAEYNAEEVIHFEPPVSPGVVDHMEDGDVEHLEENDQWSAAEISMSSVDVPDCEDELRKQYLNNHVLGHTSPVWSPCALCSEFEALGYSLQNPWQSPTSPTYFGSPEHHATSPPEYHAASPANFPCSCNPLLSNPEDEYPTLEEICSCNPLLSNPEDEYPTLEEIEHEMMEEGRLPIDFHTNFRQYCF